MPNDKTSAERCQILSMPNGRTSAEGLCFYIYIDDIKKKFESLTMSSRPIYINKRN